MGKLYPKQIPYYCYGPYPTPLQFTLITLTLTPSCSPLPPNLTLTSLQFTLIPFTLTPLPFLTPLYSAIRLGDNQD
jgi:hypothetical protein